MELTLARFLRRQRGVTLIELMISITIGLVILAALGYAYVGSRGAYRSNENLARMQEAGRFGLEFIAQDLRMTGFTGCRSRSLANTNVLMVANPPVAFAGVNDVLVGFESGTWVNPTTVPWVRGDVLLLRRASGAGVEISADTDPAAATVTIRHNAPRFNQGDFAMISNCERIAVFRVTNTPPQGAGAINVVLQHGPSLPGGGGNGNNGIVTGANSNRIPDVYAATTRAGVYRFDEVTYFIGSNPAGRPGLYRISTNGGTEELADNVEDMEILYGLDTTSPPDDIADTYVRADAVVNWAQVVAVRIGLLVAGPEIAAATSAQSYLLRDTDGDGALDRETGPDTRLRQVFTTTVALRNRVL